MRNKRKKKNSRSSIIEKISIIAVAGIILIIGGVAYKGLSAKDSTPVTKGEAETSEPEKKKEEKPEDKPKKKPKEEPKEDKSASEEIVITAAGDCTLGTDTSFNYASSLNAEIKNSGNKYGTLMKNVKDIFDNDDYTIVNLETTFTDAKTKANKGAGVSYHFKGPKEFVNILTEGGVEGVTIANNHIYDYGKQGFNDTVDTLKNAKVDFAGEGFKIIRDIKGIKVAFLGYQAWSDTKELRDKIKSDIDHARNEGALIVIPYFHWGIERDLKPNYTQTSLARYSIDSGADMVLGSHPHVIQTLENYKGKLIAYSLGNFSFGGNSNPSDKRTFMLQMKFKVEEDKIVKSEYKIIPAYISSVSNRNDYRPTIAEGNAKTKILNKLNELSPTLNGKITEEYFSLSK